MTDAHTTPEAVEWRCPYCHSRRFARCDEKKSDGSYGPGPIKRCVECKAVDWAELSAEVATLRAQLAEAEARGWEACRQEVRAMWRHDDDGYCIDCPTLNDILALAPPTKPGDPT